LFFTKNEVTDEVPRVVWAYHASFLGAKAGLGGRLTIVDYLLLLIKLDSDVHRRLAVEKPIGRGLHKIIAS
jgi:hypothetical protein